jgi:ankyrin repeat protein
MSAYLSLTTDHSTMSSLCKPAVLIMLSLILFSCSKSADKIQLNNSLISVVSRGDDTAARDFLKKGADVNARDDNGCTPVARAAVGGYLSVVRLLLESGADVNTPCNHGPNALSLAAARGQEAVVLLLIEKGADVNRRGQQGSYPISGAIEAGHAGIVRALIDYGAEVNVRYSYHAPLIHAAERGHAEIVKMLLDRGADVRATDQNGMSALMQAIDKGYPEIAKMLIERGSDINIRASDGYRPLTLARAKHQESLVQALQAAGAVAAAGPTDPFVEAASKEQAKINKVRKDLEQGGWEFFISEASVLHYLKPSRISSADSGIYRIPTMEFYTNADELFEIVLEMNCPERTYRHISSLQRDISGKLIRSIPVDSYVLDDDGHVREGSAMQVLYARVCARH